jgi:hypothetical protein
MDAGIKAAQLPVNAIVIMKVENPVTIDALHTLKARRTSPVAAIFGRSNLSATGPAKKKVRE